MISEKHIENNKGWFSDLIIYAIAYKLSTHNIPLIRK